MKEKKNLPERKRVRLRDFDYSAPGGYFITLCTQNRRCILSRIVGTGVPDGPQMRLLPHGIIAEKYIRQLDEFYEHISVEHYVIMPNHIHLLLLVKDGPSRTPVPTGLCSFPLLDGDRGYGMAVPTVQNSAVAKFISTLKRFCNKEFGENIWQRRSFDHVIRDRRDLEEHLKYISENPMRWQYDEFYVQG